MGFKPGPGRGRRLTALTVDAATLIHLLRMPEGEAAAPP